MTKKDEEKAALAAQWADWPEEKDSEKDPWACTCPKHVRRDRWAYQRQMCGACVDLFL